MFLLTIQEIAIAENINSSKPNEQRQTLRCRMILLQATNQLFSLGVVMNFGKRVQ